MSSRQGGKAKPLKAPKKDKKPETDEDKEFKERQRQEAKALKEAQELAKRGGPPGGGIKKSTGKK